MNTPVTMTHEYFYGIHYVINQILTGSLGGYNIDFYDLSTTGCDYCYDGKGCQSKNCQFKRERFQAKWHIQPQRSHSNGITLYATVHGKCLLLELPEVGYSKHFESNIPDVAVEELHDLILDAVRHDFLRSNQSRIFS